MAIRMSDKRSNVRWVADPEDPREGHFEMYCRDCDLNKKGSTFWPMTLEFWRPGNLQACIACLKARAARRMRERRLTDPVFREKCLRDSREHRRLLARVNSHNWRARQKQEAAA